MVCLPHKGATYSENVPVKESGTVGTIFFAMNVTGSIVCGISSTAVVTRRQRASSPLMSAQHAHTPGTPRELARVAMSDAEEAERPPCRVNNGGGHDMSLTIRGIAPAPTGAQHTPAWRDAAPLTKWRAPV